MGITKEKLLYGANLVRNCQMKAWLSYLKDFHKSEGGQMATILTLVTGAITLILGVIIFANVVDNTPAVTGDALNTTNNCASIFYSAADLVVIGFIVLAAVFILSIVSRLRG